MNAAFRYGAAAGTSSRCGKLRLSGFRWTAVSCSLLSLAIIGAMACRAETIELTDGSRIEGTITMKTSKMLLVRLPSGEFREIDCATVKQILTSRSYSSAAPAEAQQAASPSIPPAGGAQAVSGSAAVPAPASATLDRDACRKLVEELRAIMVFMEREKLEPWPTREPRHDIEKEEPIEAMYKAQKADGTVEYMKDKPSSTADYAKVWGKVEDHIKTVSFDDGYKVRYHNIRIYKWARVYWNERMRKWLTSHPKYFAFDQNTMQVMGFLDKLARAVSVEQSRKISTPWYELLNARAGAPKEESVVQATVKAGTENLKAEALANGNALGLGDMVWRLYELSMNIHEKINRDATDDQRLAWAIERQDLCRTVVKMLDGKGLAPR